MSISEIKKNLAKFDKEKLIELILDLYKKNNSVKEYFDFILNPNGKELLEKHKQKIFEAFYPKRGDALKLKDGKKSISDFKNLELTKEYIDDFWKPNAFPTFL